MKEEQYWSVVFAEYKESGLSQKAFCKQKDIAVGPFKYQWRRVHRKTHAVVRAKKTVVPGYFEPVLIQSSSDEEDKKERVNQVMRIRFPNQMCCEISMDIKSPEFSSLLNQLRLLC